jgi:hypothetical protein
MHSKELSDHLASYQLPVKQSPIGSLMPSVINKDYKAPRFYFSAVRSRDGGLTPTGLYIGSLHTHFLCTKIEVGYVNHRELPGLCNGLGQLAIMQSDCNGLYHKTIYSLDPIDEINVYKG